MIIRYLEIDNYKSLKNVSFAPSEFGVIVGPNAAGKSNLADAIDFLSEVYRHGLELAVARRGGYENIARRKQRRSKSAISFKLIVDFGVSGRPSIRARTPAKKYTVRAHHHFALRASGESLRAPFKVVHELLSLQLSQDDGLSHLLTVERLGDAPEIAQTGEQGLGDLTQASEEVRKDVLGSYALEIFGRGEVHAEPTELLATELRGFLRPLRELHYALENVRVFQLSPSSTREFGVPTPGAEMARAGANLPAAVDLLQRKYPRDWEQVLAAMTMVVPGLERIDVGYSRSRTLELLFQERGFGRPWTSGEVSDGTIQALALMVAIHDPRATAVVLEEPENSIHPWVIRHVIDACLEASKIRQILITTHSPVVLNHVRPESIWLMWRRRGMSRMAMLVDREPDLIRLWRDGEVSTFDFLDSGAVETAVPPPAEPSAQIEIEGLERTRKRDAEGGD